jgi:hypothetical protein
MPKRVPADFEAFQQRTNFRISLENRNGPETGLEEINGPLPEACVSAGVAAHPVQLRVFGRDRTAFSVPRWVLRGRDGCHIFPDGPIGFLNDLKMLVVVFTKPSLPRLGNVSEQYGSSRFGFGMREYLFARDQRSFWLPDRPDPQPVNETEMQCG